MVGGIYEFKCDYEKPKQKSEKYEQFFQKIGSETYGYIDKSGELILIPYEGNNNYLNYVLMPIKNNF